MVRTTQVSRASLPSMRNCYHTPQVSHSVGNTKATTQIEASFICVKCDTNLSDFCFLHFLPHYLHGIQSCTQPCYPSFCCRAVVFKPGTPGVSWKCSWGNIRNSRTGLRRQGWQTPPPQPASPQFASVYVRRCYSRSHLDFLPSYRAGQVLAIEMMAEQGNFLSYLYWNSGHCSPSGFPSIHWQALRHLHPYQLTWFDPQHLHRVGMTISVL